MPDFYDNPQDRKMSALEMLGSSDSEAVSEVDFGAMNAETSEDSEHSAEDYYSGPATESGESSASNYESTSSFEARQAKRAAKMRHGSATSKAAAAGRKQQMHMRNEKASLNTPQSIYKKQKATPAPSVKAPVKQNPKRHTKQNKEQSESGSDQSSASDSNTESDEGMKAIAPSKSSKPRKEKVAKCTAEEKAAGNKPRKGAKLPHKVINEDYEGSQEKGVPVVDSRPGKKRSRAGRKRRESRAGRKRLGKGDPMQQAVDDTELLPPQHAQILPTSAMMNARRAVELTVDDDDTMLPEEVLMPMIVNELAEDGTLVVNELKEEVRLWDAEVSCCGGYHWILGDVNSLNFADDPYTPTYIPQGEPGPNIQVMTCSGYRFP